MKTKLIILSLLLLVGMACKQEKKNNEQEQDTMLQITTDQIISPFKALADSSINFVLLKEHYKQYPERWDTAFRYLASIDTGNLPLGRINLSDDVYVSVDEYNTKNQEDAQYESHQRYIDIQYLVSGKEYIGLTRQQGIPVELAYNEEKDITFYRYDEGEKLLATSEKYFIFFPEDIHRPCMKVSENEAVKKIVVKIRY